MLEQYDQYADAQYSGEQWLGDVPNDWGVEKLKYLFSEKRHTQNLDLQCGSISFGEVITKDDDKVPLSTKASYQEVLAGEFLVNPLNLNYDLKSLRIALSKLNVVVSAGYIVLDAKPRLNKQYYKYLMHQYDIAYMKLLGSGVRQTISFNHISNSLLPFPPPEVQTAIADFLDDKTEKIDRAIAIKEAQIARLEERKQILIQNAVTRGLDPNVPMKDSGVDWIGEIPAHWEVKRLRLLGKTQNGVSSDGSYFGSGQPFVSYSDVSKNIELPRSVDGLAASNAEEQKQYSVKRGDIFFTRTSETIEEIGLSSTCFQTIPFSVFAGFLIRFRPHCSSLSSEFSKYYFSSELLRHYFVKEMTLVTRASLSQGLLKNLPVVLPPLDEQLEVYMHCQNIENKIRSSIQIQRSQIRNLKEYRSSLINSAVTGKIKVPS